MESEKNRQFKLIEDDLELISGPLREKKYQEIDGFIDKIATKFVQILSQTEISTDEVWHSMFPPKTASSLATRVFRIPIELTASKIITTCSISASVQKIQLLLEIYMKWRQVLKETYAASYAKLTPLDGVVFQRIWNSLTDLRSSQPSLLSENVKTTIQALSFLTTTKDFQAKPDTFYRNLYRTLTLVLECFNNDNSKVCSVFNSFAIFDRSVYSNITNVGLLSQASSFLRCLLFYGVCSTRINQNSEAEKSIQLANSIFQTLIENELPSFHIQLESTCLQLSVSYIRFIQFTMKPTSAALQKLDLHLQSTTKLLKDTIAVKDGYKFVTNQVPNEVYQSCIKLLGLFKDWLDIFTKVIFPSKSGKSTPIPLNDSIRTSMKLIYENMSTFVQLSIKAEAQVPANRQFKPEIVPPSLSICALTCVDLHEYEEADRFFVLAETFLKENKIFSGLKPLFTHLHFAAGDCAKLTGNDLAQQMAVKWMSKSCQLHEKYIELYPAEGTEALTAKQRLLISLQNRPAVASGDGKNPMQADIIGKMKQKNWKAQDFFPLIDAFVRSRLRNASSTQNSSFEFEGTFYHICCACEDQDPVQMSLILEFEANLYIFFQKPAYQLALVNGVLESDQFKKCSIFQARLLVLKVIGDRATSSSLTNSYDELMQSFSFYNSHLSSISKSDFFGDLSMPQIDFGAVKAEQKPEIIKIITELAFIQCLIIVLSLENPFLQVPNDIQIQQLLQNSFDVYSSVLSKMLALPSQESNVSALLLQNRSYWYSLERTVDILSLLRDLLQLHGEHRLFINCSKILIKIYSTLQPVDPKTCQKARVYLYAQIGETFNELGYTEPLASKYFDKASDGQDGNTLLELISSTQEDSEKLDEDPALDSSDVEWISKSIKFLHEIGRLPTTSAAELEQLSQSISTQKASNIVEMAFNNDILAENQYNLATIKASSGKIDEAIIESLIALKLRIPTSLKYIPQTLASGPTSLQKGNVPSTWKPSVWKCSKKFIDSLDQVGTLYQLQGCPNEAEYYYKTALHHSTQHGIKNMINHFRVKIAQLHVECKSLSTGSETSLPSILQEKSLDRQDLSGMDQEYVLTDFEENEPIQGETRLFYANALMQRGNASLKRFDWETALNDFSKAEEYLLSLIDSSYVQTLEQSEQQEPISKPKAKRGAAAIKSALAPQYYRMSMSPVKLPPVNTEQNQLPDEYFGLKRAQLRISIKKTLIEHFNSKNTAKVDRNEALMKLENLFESFALIKEEWTKFDSCPSLSMDMALVNLQLAKILILRYEIEQDIKEYPNAAQKPSDVLGFSHVHFKRDTTKPKSAKSKPHPYIEEAKALLNDALSYCQDSGFIPRIASEISEQLNLLSDPISDVFKITLLQNFSINLTLQHQILSKQYRLMTTPSLQPYEKSSPNEKIQFKSNKSKNDIDAVSALLENKLNISEPQSDTVSEQSSSDQIDQEELKGSEYVNFASHFEFNDYSLWDEKIFKKNFLDILENNQKSKNWTIITMSLGGDGDYILLSRLSAQAAPVVVRIPLNRPIDQATLSSFSPSEKVSLTKSHPALIRSVTSLISPILSSSSDSVPQLKRSSSSLQSSSRQLLTDPEPTQPERPTRTSRSSSTSKTTASAAPKRGLSSRAKTTSRSAAKSTTSIEQIGDCLDDMLANLSISGESSEPVSSSSIDSPPLLPDENIFQTLIAEFKSILKESESTGIPVQGKSQINSQKWWSERFALDSRLRSWLSNFEDSVIGSFKTLLLGKIEDDELQQRLNEDFEGLQTRVEKQLKVSPGNLNSGLFEAMFYGLDCMSIQDVIESLKYMAGWQSKKLTLSAEETLRKCATEIMEAFESAVSSCSDRNMNYVTELKVQVPSRYDEQDGNREDTDFNSITFKRQSRHSTILILDKNLHFIPWESLPVLRPLQISRMPSLSLLRASILRYLQPDSPPNMIKDGIDNNKVSYILNPGGDLENTQQALLPYFERNENWLGIVGIKPTSSDFVAALETQHLLVYCGHNAGEQYLRSEDLRRATSKNGGCAVWLMGCASARLQDNLEFDPSGLVFSYMVGGSPSVLGNLWPVTSGDLDLMTKKMMDWVHADGISESTSTSCSFSSVIPQARDRCKLKFMNGAALINYGLPIYCNPNHSNPSSQISSSTIEVNTSSRTTAAKSTGTRKKTSKASK